MSQVFYRKWRPQHWDEVLGQEHVIRTLQNAVSTDRVAHAYLFSGPRGTGKTSTARLLAKAVNCLAEDPAERPCDQCEYCRAVREGEFLDLIEIDAASNNSVDDIRDLREKINFSPNQGRYKVYIVDEVHMLSDSAFNALLKTLEEPPSHAIFVLATTEVHKVPETVRSRCQWHEFRRIPVSVVVDHLQKIAEQEGLEVEEEALVLIARQTTGSLRDAISLLDQLASTEQAIDLELTQNMLGTATNQAVITLISNLLANKASEGLRVIQETLDKGSDPRQLARQIVSYLRSVLLFKMGGVKLYENLAETEETIQAHAARMSAENLLEVIQTFNEADKMAQGFWQPSLPLELAFVGALEKLHGGRAGIQAAVQQEREKEVGSQTFYQTAKQSGAQKEEPASEEPAQDKEAQRINFAQAWERILNLVREENPLTQAILNSCQPMGIRKGKMVLSFNSPINKAKMMQENHLEITERVIQEVLGRELPLECVTRKKDQGAFPDNVDPDGMVATSMRDLGGEIVTDQDE
jgi:DNA polymerase-3 subunit gamma/tau